eukprot:TRINITY_DN15550_c0_g1_i1.p1 TRINITY_DN15550_c0_g1~~TRINITY_DN15550_c0_g1_i1.p1  ORF type:complete len:255 (-),score=41.01 TRINITY_DN15550_c0_g1_i1:12-707(-)
MAVRLSEQLSVGMPHSTAFAEFRGWCQEKIIRPRQANKLAKPLFLIDGLNVGYGGGNTFEPRNLQLVVEHFQQQKSDVVVLLRRHTKEEYPYVQSLAKLGVVYFTPDEQSDDRYFLYLAVQCGTGAYLVSNDMCGNHLHILKNNDPESSEVLARWQRTHQIHVVFDKLSHRPSFFWPEPADTIFQRQTAGTKIALHFPLVEVRKPNTPAHIRKPRQWICALSSQAPPTKSC